jgi:signal peptidase II
MNNAPRSAQWYSIAMLVFAGDQAAKSYIDMTTPLGWLQEVTAFFNLVHVLNPGAAFSFLAGAGGWQRWFFLAIALAASAWLVWQLYQPLQKLEALSYSLILGGALGNAFDRAIRGQVVDYLDFHLHGWHWPAFNVADMAIVGGAAALVLQSLVSGEKVAVKRRTGLRPGQKKSVGTMAPDDYP